MTRDPQLSSMLPHGESGETKIKPWNRFTLALDGHGVATLSHREDGDISWTSAVGEMVEFPLAKNSLSGCDLAELPLVFVS